MRARPKQKTGRRSFPWKDRHPVLRFGQPHSSTAADWRQHALAKLGRMILATDLPLGNVPGSLVGKPLCLSIEKLTTSLTEKLTT